MVFDPVTVQLIEFTDKVSGRRIVTPERPSALFSLIRENPRYGMTAWRVGPYMNVDVLNSDRHSVRVIDYATTADRKWEKFRAEKDGLRKWLKFALGFGSSSITVTVELRGESDMVRFHVDADWREIGGGDIPQLQFSLPVSYDVGRYTYDIPMGMLTRDDTPHDVPGNSFIRLGDEGRAAFIVTDSKCGFRGHDNTGSVTLIRATDGPDRYPEIGEHHFGFGIGVCDKAEQKEMAAGFTHPLTYCTGTEHVGKLPLTGRFFTLKADGIGSEGGLAVSSVKSAEDGGLVLRVVGLTNKALDASLNFDTTVPAITRAYLTDLTERQEIGSAKIIREGKAVTFTVPAYGIATLRVQF